MTSCHVGDGRRLPTVKRFSPLLILAAAAAVLAMLWRGEDEALPTETWEPVDPS